MSSEIIDELRIIEEKESEKTISGKEDLDKMREEVI